MLRLLAQGMRELGLDPCIHAPGAGGSATVPLDDKRRLVQSAVAQGGLACLVRLGRGLHAHADEPTHRALVSARDVPDLLQRWSRLERYIHSRHRVEVLALAEGRARLSHVARSGAPAPWPAEDLVVLGVLIALLEAVGARDVQAAVSGAPVYPSADAAALDRVAARRETAVWSVTWQAPPFVPRQAAPVSARQPTVSPPAPWPPLAREAFGCLCEDLASPLTLKALSVRMAMAPRSLQRRLAAAGLGYAALLAEARCRRAAAWLVESAAPVAEVGYLCGYADQPHFTRDFRARVGLTPLRYRAAFAVAR